MRCLWEQRDVCLAAQPKDPCAISLWDPHAVSQLLPSWSFPNADQLPPPLTEPIRSRSDWHRIDGSPSHSLLCISNSIFFFFSLTKMRLLCCKTIKLLFPSDSPGWFYSLKGFVCFETIYIFFYYRGLTSYTISWGEDVCTVHTLYNTFQAVLLASV